MINLFGLLITSIGGTRNILGIIIAFLLVIAVYPLPYDYYIFLRIITTIVAVIYSIKFFSLGDFKHCALYIGIAILFNPIYLFYLTKYLWTVFDLMVGSLFLWLSPYRELNKI